METAPYIAPRGYLPKSTDPVEAQAWTTDATTRVTALVATNSTTRQQAMDAWVYYRGFSYWANELLVNPLEEKGVSFSEKRDKSQIEAMKQQAKDWLDQYRELLAELGVSDAEAERLADVKTPKVYSRAARGWSGGIE